MRHPAKEELLQGLARVRKSPRDLGVVELLAVRPAPGVRAEVPSCVLTLEGGLEGDRWAKSPDRDSQVSIVNARAADLVALDKSRWTLAGDNLYVSLDISRTNLPAGQRLAVGPEAVVEITAKPHRGCRKYAAHFGEASLDLVNSPEFEDLRLRGVYAKVIRGGTVRVDDPVVKI